MPYGLLPMETLIECIYNPNDGRFKVTQPVHECDAVFGGHRIKLSREVSGRLLHNVIHDLKVCPSPSPWLNPVSLFILVVITLSPCPHLGLPAAQCDSL